MGATAVAESVDESHIVNLKPDDANAGSIDKGEKAKEGSTSVPKGDSTLKQCLSITGLIILFIILLTLVLISPKLFKSGLIWCEEKTRDPMYTYHFEMEDVLVSSFNPSSNEMLPAWTVILEASNLNLEANLLYNIRNVSIVSSNDTDRRFLWTTKTDDPFLFLRPDETQTVNATFNASHATNNIHNNNISSLIAKDWRSHKPIYFNVYMFTEVTTEWEESILNWEADKETMLLEIACEDLKIEFPNSTMDGVLSKYWEIVCTTIKRG